MEGEGSHELERGILINDKIRKRMVGVLEIKVGRS